MVAVYVYINYTGNARAVFAAVSHIRPLGPDIETDIRHERQKGRYTMSIKTIDKGEKYFCNHEEGMRYELDLDEKLKKFLIPLKEKDKVLEKLDRSGINESFLFPTNTLSHTEDLLMKKLTEKLFPRKRGAY